MLGDVAFQDAHSAARALEGPGGKQLRHIWVQWQAVALSAPAPSRSSAASLSCLCACMRYEPCKALLLPKAMQRDRAMQHRSTPGLLGSKRMGRTGVVPGVHVTPRLPWQLQAARVLSHVHSSSCKSVLPVLQSAARLPLQLNQLTPQLSKLHQTPGLSLARHLSAVRCAGPAAL